MCPLNGKCLTESIIYKATIATDISSQAYIGLSGGKFKTRYNNHNKSFKHEKYENETELSKTVWSLNKKIKSHSK